jgi:hypothetical protein
LEVFSVMILGSNQEISVQYQPVTGYNRQLLEAIFCTKKEEKQNKHNIGGQMQTSGTGQSALLL